VVGIGKARASSTSVYGIHARDYLARARSRLDEKTPEGLFYAAFELRCGVESRLQQYLEAHEETQRHGKRGWRIPELANDLAKHFDTGDKVIRVVAIDATATVVISFLYTPVTQPLRSAAGRLGGLLHSQARHHAPKDPWWGETSDFLEESWRLLSDATQGNLLGAPLQNRKSRQFHFISEPRPGELLPESPGSLVGQTMLIHVSYLDSVPTKW
jgi:hypothetical protein